MSCEREERVRLMVGDKAMERIKNTRVIVFGVGGVGSWAVESLARTGLGHITIVDSDCVEQTNINRQLPATMQTVGRPKVEVMAERIRSINPDCDVRAIQKYYSTETSEDFDLDTYDYIVDAIDPVADKALLILNATRSKGKLFSSMGAAMKTKPELISTAEFWKVKGCPLAAALRSRFKRREEFPAKKFKCVYSPEPPAVKGLKGTLAHTTAIFGFTLASLVVNDIVKD